MRTLCLSLALVLASPLATAADDAVKRFRSVLVDYFGEQGFLPVIADRGYQIGDVVNVDGVNLFARASTCFPKLKRPAPVKTTLPDVLHLDDVGMSFGLKLRKLFSSSVGADLARRIEIKFSEVTLTAVTLTDLRAALDRRACPQVAPLVDGTMQELQPGQKPYFVVSELLSGQREARLEFARRADLAVKTKELASLAGSAEVAVHGAGDGMVTLLTKTPALLAMKPVTVPNVVKVSSFSGSVRGEETSPRAQWQALQCEAGKSCWSRLEGLAEQLRAVDPGLTPADLDR